MIRLLKSILLINIFLANVSPARILGVYPVPSISHQVVFRALTEELVKRGHEVVVITPDPAYKNKTYPVNLTEIDISDLYKTIADMYKDKDLVPEKKRGVIMDRSVFAKFNINQLFYQMFGFTEVEQLIKDTYQKFDLVIAESISYTTLMFAEIFDAPVVMFSSFYGLVTQFEAIGAVTRHPFLYSHIIRDNFKTDILSKINELYQAYKFWRIDQENEKLDNNFLKSRFGPSTPTVDELKKRAVLLLVNCHPIFDDNRPVPPGTIYLGGMHLQPKKDLPEDLKSYLDNSTRGAVYVSFGTNIKPSEMHKDFLDAFLEAFKKIPYDILWKFDGENLENVPKNVKIQKWFPQRDILEHPSVKLFVTQGGMQSTDEAIEAEVPIVGVPLLGDQWRNVNKCVELGIGEGVDSYTMVADDLVEAVNKVANDPRYKSNIKKLKAIMRDQPEKPIDRAVWWVEHVLRHKGSRHLLGVAAQVSWSEYLILDVFIPLTVVCIILVTTIFIALTYVVRVVMRLKRNVKIKKQ